MTDRLIKVLEGGRYVTRGLGMRRSGPVLEISDGETLTVTVDWSGWLGDLTISSVSNTVQGVSLTSAANTTTQASFDVSATASGWIEHIITTSDGQKKRLNILVRHDEPMSAHDYRGCL